MKRLFLLFATAALQAHANVWVCSTSPVARVAIAKAELPEGYTGAAALGMQTININDVRQAYSGQPVLIGRQWLLAIMLPANHPDTLTAFSELGLSPKAAERMATGASLIDRGIRVVQSPLDMIQKISINPPAVGYAQIFTGGRDVAPCF